MSDVRSTFLQSLKYAPDTFQVRAMNSIDADASVLVAAPTGSGKTLIAELAGRVRPPCDQFQPPRADTL